MAFGNVEGSRAIQKIVASLEKVKRLGGEVVRFAQSDPQRAINAYIEAKKALVEADGWSKKAVAAGVWVPKAHADAIVKANAVLVSLEHTIQQATALRDDMRQSEPEWPGREYVGSEWSAPGGTGFTMPNRGASGGGGITDPGYIPFDGLAGYRKRRRKGGKRSCRTAKGRFKKC